MNKNIICFRWLLKDDFIGNYIFLKDAWMLYISKVKLSYGTQIRDYFDLYSFQLHFLYVRILFLKQNPALRMPGNDYSQCFWPTDNVISGFVLGSNGDSSFMLMQIELSEGPLVNEHLYTIDIWTVLNNVKFRHKYQNR